MSFFNSKKPAIILLITAVTYGVGLHLRRYYHFNKYTKLAIAKCTSIENQNVSTYADYTFYVDGKKYDGSTKLSEVNKFWINKYFKVKYSSEDPEINDILIDEMITDAEAVKAAGFKLKYDKVQNP